MTKIKIKWKSPVFWLWISIALYTVLQIITLKTRTFDGDEGVILRAVSADSWNQFWTRIANDVHPPLYHILTKASTSVFGIHEWSLRLPSAIAGGVLIILGYWLGKKIWTQSKWKSLALGIALGFSPYLFYYYQEARLYPLLLLGAVLTFGALIDLDAQKNKIKPAIIFTLGALIMVYSQHMGWFILASELLCIILMRKWQILKWSLPIIVVVAAAYLPVVRVTLVQFSGRLSEQGGLMLADNVKGSLGAIYRFGAGRLILGIEPGTIMKSGFTNIVIFAVSLLTPLIMIISGLKSNRNKLWNILAITITIVSLVMALFVSEVGGRAARYLIYLWPFYGALLIDGMWKLRRSAAGTVVIVLFIAISFMSLGRHLITENRAVGARDVARIFNNSASSADAVVVKGALAGGEEAALRYYLVGEKNIIDYYSSYKPGDLAKNNEKTEDVIMKLISKHQTIWYYDLTYGTIDTSRFDTAVQSINLGLDKEAKELKVNRIDSMQ